MKKIAIIFLFVLCSCQPIDSKLRKQYQKDLPSSAEEINSFKKQAIAQFKEGINTVLDVPNAKRTFSNTVEEFNLVGERIVDRAIILNSLSIISQNEELIQAGKKSFFQLMFETMSSFKQKPEILPTLISYASENLTKNFLGPYEWFEIYEILTSINPSLLEVHWKDQLAKINVEIATKTKTPFLFLESDAEKGKLAETISVLTLNACCLPNYQSLIFGGIRPWTDRIETLSKTMLDAKAQIICLQELFDVNAAKVLYEKLKDEYRYFYVNIAPKPFGLSPKSFGIGSGLFVASKFAINNPQYHSFQTQNTYINRGFFSFNIDNKIQLINTHLDSDGMGGEPLMARKSQLEEILAWIEEKYQQTSIPTILCGDLNIPLGSNEPAEEMLKKHFYSAYSENIKTVTVENRTYCDYTDFWWDLDKFSVVPTILDYILLYPTSSHQSLLKTSILSTSNVHKIASALSDHQGLITTYQIIAKGE